MLFTAKLIDCEPFTHQWPNGTTERYDTSLVYEVVFRNRVYNIRIAFTKERYPEGYHIIVFVNNTPKIEFAPTKDYNTTGLVMTLIKKNGRLVDINEIPPEIKSKYPVGIHRELLQSLHGFNKAVILVKSSDIDKIIELTLMRIEGLL